MAAEDDVRLHDFSSIFALEGSVAVITGGSRGLGLHAASGLLQAGCSKVYITARKAEECEAACKALNALADKRPGAQAIGIPGDVSKSSEVARLAQTISQTTDRIDILFANAGTSWGAPIERYPESGFDKVYELNIKSVFLLVQKFVLPVFVFGTSALILNASRLLPLLQKNATKDHPSRVLVTGSIAGLGIGTVGEQANFAYSMSKAAVMHLVRNLAVDLGPRHILCNSIAPGLFPSRMTLARMEVVGGVATIEKEVPNGRLGRPEDIAALVVYMCSRGGSHINGETIVIDGGNIHTRNML